MNRSSLRERERERDRGRETYFYIPGMPVNPEFHGDLHEKPFVFGWWPLSIYQSPNDFCKTEFQYDKTEFQYVSRKKKYTFRKCKNMVGSWKAEVRERRYVENKARVGHCVTLQGHVAALRFLLEKLPSDPDVSGRTLMHEAGMGYGMFGSCERSGILKISFKFFQVFQYFQVRCLRCLRCRKVVEAAATGFPAVLDELHQRGHDAKAEDFSGRSVAQNAAEGGHIEVLSLGCKKLLSQSHPCHDMPWPWPAKRIQKDP